MKTVKTGVALLGVIVLAAACSTITEELPGQASASGSSAPPSAGNFPVTVTPVTVPTPSAPIPTTPAPGGGGGGGTTPQAPVPVPVPTSVPSGGGGGGGGSTPPGNTGGSAVVKVGAKVFFVECDNGQVPESEHATEAPVGCRLHLDCTPKDSNNKPTNAKGQPQWTFEPSNLVSNANRADYTPTLTIRGAGNFTAFVVIDGVRSNDVNVRFR